MVEVSSAFHLACRSNESNSKKICLAMWLLKAGRRKENADCAHLDDAYTTEITRMMGEGFLRMSTLESDLEMGDWYSPKPLHERVRGLSVPFRILHFHTNTGEEVFDGV